MKRYLLVPLLTASLLACGPGFKTSKGSATSLSSQAYVGYSIPYTSPQGFQPASVGDTPAQVMENIKYRGCNLDGLLSDNIMNEVEALLLRSNCGAIPRAVETWANPPNFAFIKTQIDRLAAKGGARFDYGMFIAEALALNKPYADDSGRPFNFAAMCKDGSVGFWGANTCVPSLASEEYLRYVRYIVGKAAAVGLNHILFGQLGHIDPKQQFPAFLSELRAIGAAQGKQLIFGGQPNGNLAPAYLKAFDWIQGPMYIDEDLSQPCLARIKGGCQSLLFHQAVVNNANNVVVEIDWASVEDDDTHKFARKSQAERKALLDQRVSEFFSRGVGFLFPFRQWLTGDKSGNICYGFNEYLYTPHNEFGCKDETFLNAMLKGEFSKAPTPAPVAAISAADARAAVLGLFKTVMGRTDAENAQDAAGVNYWVNRVVAGLPLDSVKASLLASDEYFVRGLYRNIFRRNADDAGLEYWVGVLSSGQKTRAQVQADFNYTCSLRQTECRN